MTRYVALLRGINVGSTRKLPMAELRAICADEGFTGVATYIQSGNVVLSADLPAAAVADRIKQRIAEVFSLNIPVIVRTAEQWMRYATGSPFPDAQAERPKLLHLCLSVAPLAAGTAEALSARASVKERIAVDGDALWIDFGESIGNSKLTPTMLDKTAGSPVTARNWNTVQALAEMLNMEAVA